MASSYQPPPEPNVIHHSPPVSPSSRHAQPEAAPAPNTRLFFLGQLPDPVVGYALVVPANAETLRRLWRFYILAGLLMVCSGFCALTFPETFTLAIEQVVGWVLLFVGILAVLHTVVIWNTTPGTLSFMFLGILYVLLGYWLLVEPMVGVVSLTIILAGGLLAQGFLKINMSFQVRHVSSWPGVLVSGVLSICLAIAVLVCFQETVNWTLGLMFGVDLVVTGSSLLAVACAAYCHPHNQILDPLIPPEQEFFRE